MLSLPAPLTRQSLVIHPHRASRRADLMTGRRIAWIIEVARAYSNGMKLAPLRPADLPATTALLADACRFDRADRVAEEKLFGALPSTATPQPLGAWSEAGELVGVACTSGATLRLLAVAPAHRGRGVGSRLLDECEAQARRSVDPQLASLLKGSSARFASEKPPVVAAP